MPCAANVNEPCCAGDRINLFFERHNSAYPTRRQAKRWILGFSRTLRVCMILSVIWTKKINSPPPKKNSRLSLMRLFFFYADRTVTTSKIRVALSLFGATSTDPNAIESCKIACFNAGFGLTGAEYSNVRCPVSTPSSA